MACFSAMFGTIALDASGWEVCARHRRVSGATAVDAALDYWTTLSAGWTRVVVGARVRTTWLRRGFLRAGQRKPTRRFVSEWRYEQRGGGRAGRDEAKDLPTLPSKPLLNVGTFVGMPIRGCRGTRLLSRHPVRGLGRGAPHISRAPVALDLLQRMQHARAYQ